MDLVTLHVGVAVLEIEEGGRAGRGAVNPGHAVRCVAGRAGGHDDVADARAVPAAACEPPPEPQVIARGSLPGEERIAGAVADGREAQPRLPEEHAVGLIPLSV